MAEGFWWRLSDSNQRVLTPTNEAKQESFVKPSFPDARILAQLTWSILTILALMMSDSGNQSSPIDDKPTLGQLRVFARLGISR